MRGNAFFGNAVHLLGADLHFHALPVRADDRGMDGLVHIGLGHADIVLETARHRPEESVDHPQSLIALGHRLEDDAEGQKVVELIQGDLLGLEFAVDAVVMLQAAADFTHQIMLRQFLP